jgi:hypothetical protein
MIGFPTTATWGLLVRYWQAAGGEVLVSVRLLAAVTAATVSGLFALWWYSIRRYRLLKAFQTRQLKPLKLSSEEEEMLKFFAERDPAPIRSPIVGAHSGLEPTVFFYHWNRIFDVYHLVDHVGDPAGDQYMLSHAGRRYLIENGIIARTPVS